MSYSPLTKLVYLPVIENGMVYAQEADFQYDPNAQNMAIDFTHQFNDQQERIENTQLVAWDPVAGKARWAVNHERGGASGVLSTAGGLVFQPGSDCSFKAFDANTGEVVWETTLQMSTVAPPIAVVHNEAGKRIVPLTPCHPRCMRSLVGKSKL